MKAILIALMVTITFLTFGQGQQKKTKILLIGTFHFNNPGLDVNKQPAFDILNPSVQKELEFIGEKIKSFNPTKFFVEFDYDRQQKLDSLYKLYLEGTYFDFVKKKFPTSKYYAQCEIFQLAFRASKKSNLKFVHGIDYDNTDFPYDSLKVEIKAANQDYLLKTMEVFQPNPTTPSLTERLIELNSDNSKKENRSWYIKYANRGGRKENFVGAYLCSEWFKRNLYMYSLVQKLTTSTDERVVVLLGAGHIAMIETFVKDDDRFEIIELRDILK